MARLVWGAPGERVYETGVDRGVLYIDGDGFAWSGLISVQESPTGGDARPFYLDGQKYLNISAAEEFEATIEAFGTPKEFGPCDGTQSVHNGLFATQQPRKKFDFSYRTMIGTDVSGEAGYKVHLVYNALAAPIGRTYKTLGDQVDPSPLSIAFTTLPPPITGYRPTAHFVVDSRLTDPATLETLESALYGSDENPAAFPPLDALISLFSG